jgi:hypothetical protein
MYLLEDRMERLEAVDVPAEGGVGVGDEVGGEERHRAGDIARRLGPEEVLHRLGQG